MVLVVGATGFVGGTIARRLRERGSEVRALVRGGTGHAAAAALVQAGAGIVAGKLEDASSLAAACAGVETVVCTATAMPAAAGDALQRVDTDGVLGLMEAAEGAGVRRFVYTSFSGNIAVESPLVSAKRACESRLADSRMEFVVLRPSYFMEVWLGPHLGFDVAQAKARIYGDGMAGISYVSAGDVAAFAVAAATMPGEIRDVVEIGGPEAITQLEVVATFERELRRPFEVEHVPMAALEAQYQTADPLQKTFAALMMGCATGDAIPDARKAAKRFGVTLTSVADYAATFRN